MDKMNRDRVDIQLVQIAEDIERKAKELLETALRGDYEGLSRTVLEISQLVSIIEEKLALVP